jgi:putative endopeptidase
MKINILKPLYIIFIAAQLNAQNPGINIADIDRNIDPRDDFYSFANGTWAKKTQIPAQDAMWSSFNEMGERNDIKLKKILEDCVADKTAKPGSNKQKLGDLYRCGMDTLKIEKQGFSPLLPYLTTINKITDKTGLLKVLGELHSIGVSSLFSFYIDADMKGSDENAVYFSQPELGLPDKTYYTDATYTTICQAYKKHIATMLTLLGDNANDAAKNAETIFAIETQMADASMGSVELRDSDKQYNKLNKDIFF